MKTKFYVEDCDILEEIKKDDTIMFKHKDTAVYFTTDGAFLYIHDIDEPTLDLFRDGNFKEVITDYYQELDQVNNLLKLTGLELSSFFNTFTCTNIKG